jgi:hypothetical protein
MGNKSLMAYQAAYPEGWRLQAINATVTGFGTRQHPGVKGIIYVSRGADYAVRDGKPKIRAGGVRPAAVM